jgi:putative transposase
VVPISVPVRGHQQTIVCKNFGSSSVQDPFPIGPGTLLALHGRHCHIKLQAAYDGEAVKGNVCEYPSSLYRRHRFPPAIISHAVYLYFRFNVSYREVEEMLARRGITVSYETIRRWCLKFGPAFAAEIQRRRPAPRDRRHLDEMHLRIGGRTYYLWRAVDADGMVLDVFLQRRRNQSAAETLLQRLLNGQPTQPRVIVTDKPAGYGPAIRKPFPHAEHRAHKGVNKGAGNSHQPTRQRERARRRFKSPAHTQRFLEPFGPIRQHFCPGRHLLAAPTYRRILAERCVGWDELTGAAA